MLDIHHIPFWTNHRRRRFLATFRAELGRYFDELRHEAFPYRVVESERASEARAFLEPRLKRCRSVVRAAGGPTLTRLAPAERTGEVVRVNVLDVVFDLARYNLRKEEVFRVLEDAEARYRADRARSWLRTLNPLYWLDMALGTVEIAVLLPARLLGWDPRRVARSTAGTGLRYLARATLLVLLGWLAVRGLGGEERLLSWSRALRASWF